MLISVYIYDALGGALFLSGFGLVLDFDVIAVYMLANIGSGCLC